jgi:hypothetical protein
MLFRNLTSSLCASLDERSSSIHDFIPAPVSSRQASAVASITIRPAKQRRHWLHKIAWLPFVVLGGALLLTGWLPAFFLMFALLLPALAPLLLALAGMMMSTQ